MFRSRVSTLRNIGGAVKSQRRSLSTYVVAQPKQKSINALFIGLSVGSAAALGCYLYNKNSRSYFAESSVIRQLFDKYATGVTEDNEMYMTEEDMNLLLEPFPQATPAILFKLLQQEQNPVITYQVFEQLYNLLNKSDAEYRIAFRLADKDRDGLISKEDFKDVILHDTGRKFDWDSDWINLFFGKNGKANLSYNEFSQLLEGLQTEQVRQEFLNNCNSDGLINKDQFVEIITHARFQIPPGVTIAKIKEMANLNSSRGEGVSFAQFTALINLFQHLPSYATVFKDASRLTGKDEISPDVFLEVARRTLDNFTPLECSLVYHFFDAARDGTLDINDFERFAHKAAAERVVAKKEFVNEVPHESALKQVFDGVSRFTLGAISGGIGATTVYPIDLVKTRMQNQRNAKGSASEKMYKNSWDCFLKVLRNEGAGGLYKGLGPQLVGVAPEKAIKLSTNDLLRSIFSDKKGDIGLPLEIIAGGGAGASQVIFTNPLEIVKIRLQVQGEAVRMGALAEKQSAMSIVRELGISGLYKGASACLLRDIPFSAIYFPTYAKMKNSMKDESGVVQPFKLLLAGAIAGVPAAGLVTPADVIKTRLQVKYRTGDIVYNGIFDCAKKILAQEGFVAFWKGALARVFRSSPQFGVTLLSYELLQRFVFGTTTGSTPPTNVPVSAQDMAQFHSNVSKMDSVEKKWFSVYGKA